MPKEVDVLALLDMVAFAPEEVVDASCGNTTLYVTAIQYRLRCLEKVTEAKKKWEQACAEMDLKLRKEAQDTGAKITEGQIDARVLLNKQIAALADEYHKAEVYEEYSKLVTRVFEMRRDMLEVVANMISREYPISKTAEAASDRMRIERRKLRQRFPEE